ncbi:MAG: transporter [Sulfurovum sp. FS08-3]|nr:MAG: transporter [Sulfurovum sp. FS08-3]
MSYLVATVKQIESCENLHIVAFDYRGQTLRMMSLDLADAIAIGTKVKLTIKPSHIALAKNFEGELSCSNQLQTTIVSITNGELLSAIKLDFLGTLLESIVTLSSSQRMDLRVGEEIVALIKASELSIDEVIND